MADRQDHRQKNDIASEILEHLKNPPVEVTNPNKNSGSNVKKYLIITLVLIILFGIGGFAVWKFLLNNGDQTSNLPVAETQNRNNGQDEGSLERLTQEYTSDRLLIDFKYPDGWKVDENSGEIMVYSPETEITDANGERISAEFRVLIKQGARETDSEYLGRGFAIKGSEPIKYADPSSNQREESLITDFGLDSSNYFSYFVVQGNFKLKKGETLGSDFAAEADEILVSGGFYSKDSKDKTKLVSLYLGDYDTNDMYLSALEIIKTLKLR